MAAALAGGARVIPLLIDGTPMPGAAQLPADLQALPGRNALALGHASFGADFERLAAALDGAVPAARRAPPRRAAVVAGLALLGLGAAPRPGASARRMRSTRRRAAPQRAAVNGVWEAPVRYDWPNADHLERFAFAGDGDALHGTASFLRVPRGVLEGRVARRRLAVHDAHLRRCRAAPASSTATARGWSATSCAS